MHEENRHIAADGMPHLTIPGYALRPMPTASKRTARVLDDKRILKRTMPNIQKATALHHRDSALHYRITCLTMARSTRELAIAIHGANPGPNSTPISGGTCDHWPLETQKLIVAYERAAGAWADIALAWHCYAGKHAQTFRRLTTH
jgi:hypothetical protein